MKIEYGTQQLLSWPLDAGQHLSLQMNGHLTLTVALCAPDFSIGSPLQWLIVKQLQPRQFIANSCRCIKTCLLKGIGLSRIKDLLHFHRDPVISGKVFWPEPFVSFGLALASVCFRQPMLCLKYKRLWCIRSRSNIAVLFSSFYLIAIKTTCHILVPHYHFPN